MASQEALFLYKETRLNLEPASPANVVNIRLPATNGAARSSNRRTNGAGNLSDEERAYRAKNLSVASSIFYRKHHDSPRAFLWRVLDDGKILSVRVADVCKPDKTPDAGLILHFHFPNGLRPSCVGFADPENQDALCLFVLDEADQLWNLVLRPDFFRKRSALENGLGEACKPHSSAAFHFKQPHRLFAVSADEFIVTLFDGGILRFHKIKGHEASEWKESFHSPTSWTRNLRSILPFQGGPTVKYGGTNMDMTAAASAVMTSMDLDHQCFLFTVCLDHRLRVWNVPKGEIAYTGDILGLNRDPQEIGKWSVNPDQSNLIRIMAVHEGSCIFAVYSPVGAGTFKFWKATALADGKIELDDVFEDRDLVPPTPSAADVWTLADFGVSQGARRSINLWVLWKNNLIYRVTKLHFTKSSLKTAWIHDWVNVFADTSYPTAQSSGPCDPIDPTEKWLQVIFHPGRFSRSTLETALQVYERGLGSAKEAVSSKGGKGLAEAICSVLGATATLEKGSGDGMDYDQFRSTSETQWRRFYRLVIELDKQRGEALSLVVDPELGITWVVCADCIGAIRECSALDRVYHNLDSPETGSQHISSLLVAGTTFMESFSDGMQQLCVAALRSELYEDSAKTDYERIQYFSDKAGFWRQVTEEDCAQVTDLLGENFKVVDMDLYQQLLGLIEESEEARNRDVRHPFTSFGQKLAIKGVQETAELHWRVLLSQLILLVHMEFEFDNDEDALHSRFDIGLVYRQMILALKRLELVRWLARTEVSVALPKSERASFSGTSPATTKRTAEETQVITVLEAALGHLLGMGEVTDSLASNLTEVITGVCAPRSSLELEAPMVQCLLLKRDRPDLADGLSGFVRQDPFPVYIQGRVSLALRDYASAATSFRRAAIGMSTPQKHLHRHSAGLMDDTEWNLIYTGSAKYYSHIASLFDRQKAYAQVIDFARLSLQFATGQDASTQSVRSEMLSRLFTASTALSRFDLAHSTLLSMTNRALQHSCLRTLVEKMCDAAQTAELIALPFCGLQGAVDDTLLAKCLAPTRDGGSAPAQEQQPPYHQILYAWRVAHGDYRGAAAVLLDRLQKLRAAGEGDRLLGDDALDTPVTKQYLLLINVLSCVAPKQAWICTEDLEAGGPESGGGPARESEDPAGLLSDGAGVDDDDGADGRGDREIPEKFRALLRAQRRGSVSSGPEEEERRRRGTTRKVVTLAELRKQYQEELDRIAAIQNNQFEFAEDEDDAMDES
ncbi:uncharacterized protein E0L32_007875 [Thyridium curvatum]|uniref:Uncharacterized protein n=1 Tax=Thyridium curvatum TaxID=1093900 RepID=A0A507AXI0_9PEZI|nr:uncharacterized protein E0L32_007875 [Thyridium curvatum]TPX11456.1 hypothetical protein E0L32_007875 [Thyridium curvatum]